MAVYSMIASLDVSRKQAGSDARLSTAAATLMRPAESRAGGSDKLRPDRAVSSGYCGLVPGQRITDIVEYLVRYLRVKNKVELHGIVCQGYVPSIRVLSAEEERHLVALVAARPSRRRSA